MLESFLGVPELLTDEQVMTLLKLAFNTSVVVNQLSIYLTEMTT